LPPFALLPHLLPLLSSLLSFFLSFPSFFSSSPSHLKSRVQQQQQQQQQQQHRCPHSPMCSFSIVVVLGRPTDPRGESGESGAGGRAGGRTTHNCKSSLLLFLCPARSLLLGNRQLGWLGARADWAAVAGRPDAVVSFGEEEKEGSELLPT
jgi:hypothetical protein